jgi:diaminopimelate decarboxylase/L-glutamyl-[BtrI acyl-carrier protein] decarboxylase
MRKEEFYKIIPKEEIKKLVTQRELPTFIYFKKIVKRKYGELLDCLPGGFEIHYAFKANPNQDVLGFIRSLGAGADVASLGELRLATGIGYPIGKIEFTGPGKTIEELSLAIDLGISSINVESISEIKNVNDLCRAKEKPANLGIRLNPKAKTSSSAMKMSGDTQFGITEDDLEEAFALIQNGTKLLNFTGLHMHLGSQFLEAEKIISNFRLILEKANEIANLYKIDLRKINFGGGWGIDIFGNKPPLDLRVIKRSLSELFADSKYRTHFKSTRFIVEPGRFLVAECGIYAVKVLYRKKGYKKEFLVVNGGMHQNYLAAGGIGQVIRRNLETDVIPENNCGEGTAKFTIVGSLCIPDDVLASELELPSEMKKGDILFFHNCGAYGYSASPLKFLSHAFPKEIVI